MIFTLPRRETMPESPAQIKQGQGAITSQHMGARAFPRISGPTPRRWSLLPPLQPRHWTSDTSGEKKRLPRSGQRWRRVRNRTAAVIGDLVLLLLDAGTFPAPAWGELPILSPTKRGVVSSGVLGDSFVSYVAVLARRIAVLAALRRLLGIRI